MTTTSTFEAFSSTLITDLFTTSTETEVSKISQYHQNQRSQLLCNVNLGCVGVVWPICLVLLLVRCYQLWRDRASVFKAEVRRLTVCHTAILFGNFLYASCEFSNALKCHNREWRTQAECRTIIVWEVLGFLVARACMYWYILDRMGMFLAAEWHSENPERIKWIESSGKGLIATMVMLSLITYFAVDVGEVYDRKVFHCINSTPMILILILVCIDIVLSLYCFLLFSYAVKTAFDLKYSLREAYKVQSGKNSRMNKAIRRIEDEAKAKVEASQKKAAMSSPMSGRVLRKSSGLSMLSRSRLSEQSLLSSSATDTPAQGVALEQLDEGSEKPPKHERKKSRRKKRKKRSKSELKHGVAVAALSDRKIKKKKPTRDKPKTMGGGGALETAAELVEVWNLKGTEDEKEVEAEEVVAADKSTAVVAVAEDEKVQSEEVHVATDTQAILHESWEEARALVTSDQTIPDRTAVVSSGGLDKWWDNATDEQKAEAAAMDPFPDDAQHRPGETTTIMDTRLPPAAKRPPQDVDEESDSFELDLDGFADEIAKMDTSLIQDAASGRRVGSEVKLDEEVSDMAAHRLQATVFEDGVPVVREERTMLQKSMDNGTLHVMLDSIMAEFDDLSSGSETESGGGSGTRPTAPSMPAPPGGDGLIVATGDEEKGEIADAQKDDGIAIEMARMGRFAKTGSSKVEEALSDSDSFDNSLSGTPPAASNEGWGLGKLFPFGGKGSEKEDKEKEYEEWLKLPAAEKRRLKNTETYKAPQKMRKRQVVSKYESLKYVTVREDSKAVHRNERQKFLRDIKIISMIKVFATLCAVAFICTYVIWVLVFFVKPFEILIWSVGATSVCFFLIANQNWGYIPACMFCCYDVRDDLLLLQEVALYEKGSQNALEALMARFSEYVYLNYCTDLSKEKCMDIWCFACLFVHALATGKGDEGEHHSEGSQSQSLTLDSSDRRLHDEHGRARSLYGFTVGSGNTDTAQFDVKPVDVEWDRYLKKPAWQFVQHQKGKVLRHRSRRLRELRKRRAKKRGIELTDEQLDAGPTAFSLKQMASDSMAASGGTAAAKTGEEGEGAFKGDATGKPQIGSPSLMSAGSGMSVLSDIGSGDDSSSIQMRRWRDQKVEDIEWFECKYDEEMWEEHLPEVAACIEQLSKRARARLWAFFDKNFVGWVDVDEMLPRLLYSCIIIFVKKKRCADPPMFFEIRPLIDSIVEEMRFYIKSSDDQERMSREEFLKKIHILFQQGIDAREQMNQLVRKGHKKLLTTNLTTKQLMDLEPATPVFGAASSDESKSEITDEEDIDEVAGARRGTVDELLKNATLDIAAMDSATDSDDDELYKQLSDEARASARASRNAMAGKRQGAVVREAGAAPLSVA